MPDTFPIPDGTNWRGEDIVGAMLSTQDVWARAAGPGTDRRNECQELRACPPRDCEQKENRFR